MAKEFKYLQIKQWVTKSLSTGALSVGEKIPSEQAFMNKFSVSRQTVRKAMDELADEGIIERKKGSGMYVRQGLQRDRTIGVLLSYANEYIFPSLVSRIQGELMKKDYAIDLGLTYNQIQNEKQYLERVINNNYSGFIIEGSKTGFPNPNVPLYEELYRKGIPVVFLHNYYEKLSYPRVLMDDASLSYQLTMKLLDAGHRKIVGIFKCDDLQGHRRYLGYCNAILEKNNGTDSVVYWFSDTSELLPIFQTITEEGKCTGIVCYNDRVAMSLCQYLAEEGFAVPEDYSVVGFDDLRGILREFMRDASFNITSARYPRDEIAMKTMQLLFEMIEGGVAKHENETYECQAGIAERESIKSIQEEK